MDNGQVKAPAGGRANNFDAVRLVAALMVMAGHMGFIVGLGPPLFLGWGVQSLGVSIFFLVGGYLITKSWLSDPCVKRYALKRFFRIIPPLAVYVLLAALVVGPFLSTLDFASYYANPATWSYLKNILLQPIYRLPGVFEANPYPGAVNGSLWALPVEVAMYVVMPVVVALIGLKKQSRLSHVLLVALAALACAAQLIHIHFFSEASLVIYGSDVFQAMALVPFYLIGSVYALPGVKEKLNLQLGVVLVLLMSCFSMSQVMNTFWMYLVFPYLVFSVALAAPPLFAHTFEKFEISYGLFLYGFFIQQIAVLLGTTLALPLNLNHYNVLCICATAAVAYLSYKFVETPSLKLSKKLLALPIMQPKPKEVRQDTA